MYQAILKYFDAPDLKGLFVKVFLAKTKSAHIQFFRYLFVGGFSAVVNLAVLFVCTSLFNIHYLLSELIAFIIATIINYVLSVWWIFERSNRFKMEFLLFTLVGVGGLGINETVLWICASKLHLYYLLAEAIAIAVVTVWSFALRRVMFTKLQNQPAKKSSATTRSRTTQSSPVRPGWFDSPTKRVLIIFAVFALVLYVPFVLKGGFQYDDWSAAGLSKACPGLFHSFSCYWPNYPDRPLASLYYSIDSNVFHAWAPGYIIADVLEWTGGALLAFTVLKKRFGLNLAVPFLFVAAIPSISTTTIFSPAMQAIGSFTFLLWATSFYFLDKYLVSQKQRHWWLCYGFIFFSLLFYESSTPLFAVSALWPLLVDPNPLPTFTYWKRYALRYILPIIVILIVIGLYQDLIVLHFYKYISKVRIQDTHNLFNFGLRVVTNTLYILTIGVADLSLRGLVRLRSSGIWTAASAVALAAIAGISMVKFGRFTIRPSARLAVKKRKYIFWLVIVVIAIGITAMHFIANAPPTMVGYNNRGLVSGSILVALVAAWLWYNYFSRRLSLSIIGVLCFLAYLGSFVVQRDNYIAGNTERRQIQAAAIKQINAVNQPGMYVLANVPTYTDKNFDNETVYSDEVLDWENSLELESRVISIRGISLSPGRITRGELEIRGDQLEAMHNVKNLVPIRTIWYYDVVSHKLAKIQSTKQLQQIFSNEATHPPTYPLPVDAQLRQNLQNWLASY